MNKEQKADSVAEILEDIKSSSAIFLVDYKAINVADNNNLKKKFRKEGVKYKI